MEDCTNIEFHRSGYGMLPDMRDKDPGMPICFPRSTGGEILTGKCDCRESRKEQACAHFERLVRVAHQIRKQNGGCSWGDAFSASLWYRLAAILSEGDARVCPDLRVARNPQERSWAFLSPGEVLLARLLDCSEASLRLLERIGKAPESNRFRDRAALIRQLAVILRGEDEKRMNEAGVLTRRQTTEQSFWGLLAYHCFREYGAACTFHPSIEQASGDFVLKCRCKNGELFLELVLPRRRVRKALGLLAAEFPRQADLAIHPVPLRSIFLVSPKTKLDLEVRPMIQTLQSSGEARFLASEDFARFRYGDLVYLREMNILAVLETPGAGRRFVAPTDMKLKRSLLPAYLDEHRRDLEDGLLVLDDPLRDLSILREHDTIEIVPEPSGPEPISRQKLASGSAGRITTKHETWIPRQCDPANNPYRIVVQLHQPCRPRLGVGREEQRGSGSTRRRRAQRGCCGPKPLCFRIQHDGTVAARQGADDDQAKAVEGWAFLRLK
jgi:hypothetical protein